MDADDRKYLSLGFRVVGEFGAIIAVPIVLFTLAGKWLDGRYGTKPAFLLAGFALAVFVSAVSIVRKARSYGKEYERLEEGKKGRREEGKK